ncbi:hypothetical protein ACFQI7_02870 [Paenibacillus allorhizosphaerae]|uniref:Uncharacterized protein n=1 Tax=Paenibacillus allorhizosphaerae TaxID=2849866 RepID=A0ABM8VB76_9BACL|nr:hypothetical protein [Paenibacillus allorhizosphaerae]CAG7618632.1 hypothetical protein PAECIP111802_00537 [Paenibacillus allorhizosphaerae]
MTADPTLIWNRKEQHTSSNEWDWEYRSVLPLSSARPASSAATESAAIESVFCPVNDTNKFAKMVKTTRVHPEKEIKSMENNDIELQVTAKNELYDNRNIVEDGKDVINDSEEDAIAAIKGHIEKQDQEGL